MDFSASRQFSLLENTSMLRIIIAITSISVVYLIFTSIYDVYFGPLSKVPGPKLRAFSKIPWVIAGIRGKDAKISVELHQKYGPIVRLAPHQLSFAGGAQAFKDVYGFKKYGQRQLQKDPQTYMVPVNGTHGIISADDENHARMRRTLTHSFSDKALKEQEPIFGKWAALMKKKLLERADGIEKVDLLKFYNCTTFDVMGDLTFAEGLNMLEESEYSPWVKMIFGGIKVASILRFVRSSSWISRFMIDNLIFKSSSVSGERGKHFAYSTDRVNRRLKREPEHPDFWSKIISKDGTPGGLSLAEMHSNASTFMIAGTETTATALSGTTYHLLQNPKCLQKLTAEIREAFPNFESITFEGLARLKYLHAVLQEGLRMYPPVPVALPRVTPKEGAIIDDCTVPADVVVGVSHLATYRMSQNFKDPFAFRPERWLHDAEYRDDHLDACEPMSVGPRNCIGKNLAWHEMRLLLATTLLSFDLKLCEESGNWDDQKVYILWEKKPLMATLVPAKA